MPRPSALAALLLAAATACAHRGPAAPPVITSASPTATTPETKRESKGETKGETKGEPTRDRSRGGQERGTLEFVLAGVTGALSGTLITLGILEISRAQGIRDYCVEEPNALMCMPLIGDPAVSGVVSGSLALFWAAPSAIASGFLIRRGLRIRRDAQRFGGAAETPTATLHPWARPGSGGLGLRLRF